MSSEKGFLWLVGVKYTDKVVFPWSGWLNPQCAHCSSTQPVCPSPRSCPDLGPAPLRHPDQGKIIWYLIQLLLWMKEWFYQRLSFPALWRTRKPYKLTHTLLVHTACHLYWRANEPSALWMVGPQGHNMHTLVYGPMALWPYHPQNRGFEAPSIQATGSVDQRWVTELAWFFWSSRDNAPSCSILTYANHFLFI